MTNPSPSKRYQFEYPDEAGYPDGVGTLTEDRVTLIDQVLDADEKADTNIAVVNEEESQVYTAIVGDTAVGGVTYSRVGDRLVLQAAAVYPEFRGQGIATEMIRQVLDDVRSHGEKVTNLCPIVRTFVDKHPQYEDVIDPKNPGVVSRNRS
ncbi:GNAT family N-acetyltransferase [Rathayibacter sp. KR2-224]|uniref:GNAT family N-acetyltransferase n=1 Tax=Rathayibacter sp. KR2-224 TaxID=3400913 RepID=UPI003C01E505